MLWYKVVSHSNERQRSPLLPVAETILKCMHWSAGSEYYFYAIILKCWERKGGSNALAVVYFFFFLSFFLSFFLFLQVCGSCIQHFFISPLLWTYRLPIPLSGTETSQSKLVSWQLYILNWNPFHLFEFWFLTPLNNNK